MSDLSQVTVPPDRRVSVTVSPLEVCPFTDSVPPEVMNTISADAADEAPIRHKPAAIATRAVLSTCIGTKDLSIWLAGLSRIDTVELLRLHVRVEDPDAQVSGIGPARLERLIDVNDQIHQIGGPQLGGADRERQERRRLGVGRELPDRLIPHLQHDLLRRVEEIDPRVVLKVQGRVLLRVLERDGR